MGFSQVVAFLLRHSRILLVEQQVSWKRLCYLKQLLVQLHVARCLPGR